MPELMLTHVIQPFFDNQVFRCSTDKWHPHSNVGSQNQESPSRRDRPVSEVRLLMQQFNSDSSIGPTKASFVWIFTKAAASAVSKRLSPMTRMLIRLLLYVPDSYPVIENTLRGCDFLLLLINISIGLNEIIHGGVGLVTLPGLTILLLYGLVHGLVVLSEIIRFVQKNRK